MLEGIVLFILFFILVVIALPLILFFVMQSKVSRLQVDIHYLKQRVDKLQTLVEQFYSAKTTDIQQDILESDSGSVTSQAPVTANNVSPIETETPQATAPQHYDSASIVESLTKNNDDIAIESQLPLTKPEVEISFSNVNELQSSQDKPTNTKVSEQKNALGANLIRWFITGNLVAKVAVIILFLGLSYLLKYSIDHGLLSPEIRILGSLVLGVGLFTIGWLLRTKKQLYALIVQGAAIGVLYFTIFAAYKYDLLPMLLAFGILVVICATSVVFAVVQRAISLAIMAYVGGYLAPVLLSTNSGNYIGLFSYYLLISSSILVISFWQSWRLLNLIGFVFTFVMAFVWGMRSFEPEFYPACQLFVIANLIIYGVVAVLLSVRSAKTESYQHLFDMILLFSVPLIGFAFQYAISQHIEFLPAFSALGFGLLYLLGSYWVLRVWKGRAKQLALYAIAIGFGFSSLAVPLALTVDWTALVWLFEGTAISYIALYLRQYRFGWLGGLIVLLGGICALIALMDPMSNYQFIVLFGLFSGLLLVNACLWFYYQAVDQSAVLLQRLFIVLAALAWTFWIIAGMPRILEVATQVQQSIIIAFVITVWLWFMLGRKLNWPLLSLAVIALWPLLVINIFVSFSIYWLASALPIGWLLAFASAYFYLFSTSQQLAKYKHCLSWLHISLFWMVVIWLYNEVSWQLGYLPWGFSVVAWSCLTVFAGLIVLVAFSLQIRRYFPLFSPVIPNLAKWYWLVGLAPVALYLLFKLLSGLTSSGQIIYWTYIPLLNPLELSAIFGLMMLGLWMSYVLKLVFKSSISSTRIQPPLLIATLVMIGLTFLWANSMILRCLSDWLSISWSFYSLWHDNVVQVVLSLVWTSVAVILIAIANHYLLRKVWFTGAGLQGLVVIKLALVDSVELAGLMRAFVFIGVALLMLVIGYLAPLPPKIIDENIGDKKDSDTQDTDQLNNEHASSDKE